MDSVRQLDVAPSSIEEPLRPATQDAKGPGKCLKTLVLKQHLPSSHRRRWPTAEQTAFCCCLCIMCLTLLNGPLVGKYCSQQDAECTFRSRHSKEQRRITRVEIRKSTPAAQADGGLLTESTVIRTTLVRVSVWGIPAPGQLGVVMPIEVGLGVAVLVTLFAFPIGYGVGRLRGRR